MQTARQNGDDTSALRLLQSGRSVNPTTSRGEHLLSLGGCLQRYSGFRRLQRHDWLFVSHGGSVHSQRRNHTIAAGRRRFDQRAFKQGENALFLSVWRGHEAVVKVLALYGADVKTPSPTNPTGLPSRTLQRIDLKTW